VDRREATADAAQPADAASVGDVEDVHERSRWLASTIRLRAARMVARHGFGYLGQALSSAETFAVLAAHWWRPGRDDLVISPGHYILCAYAIGVEFGLLEEAALDTYGEDGSSLEAIGTESSPVVDLTCGSLGQGLSGAIGFALAARLDGEPRRTFAFLSDGELQEGQVWEAAMFAGHHQLGDLVVLLDANNSQVDGPVDSITTIEPIVDKWRSFGWDAFDVDGHDVAALHAAMEQAVRSPRPAVVIARTSTLHGVESLPDDADGHFIKLPPDLAGLVVTELEER
jgi:transketolase